MHIRRFFRIYSKEIDTLSCCGHITPFLEIAAIKRKNLLWVVAEKNIHQGLKKIKAWNVTVWNIMVQGYQSFVTESNVLIRFVFIT